MRIAITTQYNIGETVKVPVGNTTRDTQIMDVFVHAHVDGLSVSYHVDDPDIQLVKEPIIIGLAAPIPPSNPMFANKPF